MAEEGGIIGSLCGICCFSSCEAWCNQKAFGANGCSGSSNQRGCCNSCCDDAFNEDSFDKPQKGRKPVESQPPAVKDMNTSPIAPVPNSETAAITDP